MAVIFKHPMKKTFVSPLVQNLLMYNAIIQASIA